MMVSPTVLASLVEKYVDTIVKGKVPCVESAVTALARTRNTEAVAEAVAEYRKGMEQDLVLPTDSRAMLVDVHRRWERRAVTLFLSHAFADNERTYQCQLIVSHCRTVGFWEWFLFNSDLFCGAARAGGSQRGVLPAQRGGIRATVPEGAAGAVAECGAPPAVWGLRSTGWCTAVPG